MQKGPSHQEQLQQKRRCWSEIIACWQESGLSQIDFCRRHDLKYHRFVYWRQKFAPKPDMSIAQIVEVPALTIGQGAGTSPWSSGLRVVLAADVSIEVSPGFDALTLEQVVLTLRGLR